MILKLTEYEFTGLDMSVHKLSQVIIEKEYPRFLLYSLNDEKMNQINQENVQNEHINTNRQIGEEDLLKVSVKNNQ